MIAAKNGHTNTVKCLDDAKAQLDLQSYASTDQKNKINTHCKTCVIL